MLNEKVLVIGLGEVGLPLFELIKESGKFEVFGLDTNQAKMDSLKQTVPPEKIDIIHICLPCVRQEDFVSVVTGYIKRFQPQLTIVNSTVPLGTTASLYKNSNNSQVVHSPIRGVHKGNEHMKWEIGRWTKYIGGATREAAEAARHHFEKLGLKTKVLGNSTETELAKLFETTYRAWMISCFQEMHRISVHFKANFDNVVDFLEDTHRVRLDRPIMFPGEIGGHCIIPNTRLLMESYDSKFLKLILQSNERREQEMKDLKVFKEAEILKRRAEKLQKDLMDKWNRK